MYSLHGPDPDTRSPDDFCPGRSQTAGGAALCALSPKYIGDWANGNICVAVGFSGDILKRRPR
jgi:putrescine transport system substrate-binding protein